MAVMSGNVNVTVRVEGVGSAPSKVTESAKAIDKVAESGTKASASISSFKDRVGALKTSVGPVNVLREGFENLRSNAGFLIGTMTVLGGVVAGAVSAVIEFVSGEDRAARAAARWDQNQSKLNDTLNRGWGLLTKTSGSALEEQLSDVNVELAKAKVIIKDLESGSDEWVRATSDVERLTRLRSALERVIAADTQVTRDNIFAMKRTMEEMSRIEVPLLSPFTGNSNDPSLKLHTDLAGTAYTDEQWAAREKRLKEAADRARRTRGGGGSKPEQTKEEGVDAVMGRGKWASKEDPTDLGDLIDGFESDPDGVDQMLNRKPKPSGKSKPFSPERTKAHDIRDFSAALSDSLPGMSEFSGALRDISSSWADVAAANDNAAEVYQKYLNGEGDIEDVMKARADARQAEARGAISSIGAIATAGAEQIKNERLRAGVLATIQLGLGTAMMFVNPAEAAGHFAAAAILGSVAIFGGGSGSGSSRGGKSRSGSSRSVSRTLSDPAAAGGGWSINIFGGWFGAGHPAETAAALHALSRRGAGSGYVPLPRAG